MLQDIHNESPIEQQFNVGSVEGNIIVSKKTRFAKRFESLKSEVLNDKRYDEIMDSLHSFILNANVWLQLSVIEHFDLCILVDKLRQEKTS